MEISTHNTTTSDVKSKYPIEVIAGPGYSDLYGYGSAVILNEEKAAPALISKSQFKINPTTSRPQIELFVTSEKELKWRPAVNFVVNLMRSNWPDFSENDITLRTLKVDSGIAEQPIGRNAGVLGARGRCSDLRITSALESAKASGENVMVVSFENTIAIESLNREMPKEWQELYGTNYLDAQNCIPVDIAAVCFKAAIGKEFYECVGFSDGVTLPLKYLEEAASSTQNAQAQHGYDITCGKLIARDSGLPDTNWHLGFTGQSRDQLLIDGINGLAVRVI